MEEGIRANPCSTETMQRRYRPDTLQKVSDFLPLISKPNNVTITSLAPNGSFMLMHQMEMSSTEYVQLWYVPRNFKTYRYLSTVQLVKHFDDSRVIFSIKKVKEYSYKKIKCRIYSKAAKQSSQRCCFRKPTSSQVSNSHIY